MATLTANGTNGFSHSFDELHPLNLRFSDIPNAIDIPVSGLPDDEQAVEVDLMDLMEDPTELCTLLENERAARQYWLTIALAYAKQKQVDHAIDILNKGAGVDYIPEKDKINLNALISWLLLRKTREAPRLPPEGQLASEVKTKEHYLGEATRMLNKALNVNATFPPLFLARGVIQLLRASTLAPPTTAGQGVVGPEKANVLRSALKSFDDALRASAGRNMMAVMGKARANYGLAKYDQALEGYQEVLLKMPDLTDPDPRIGIGCCFWQLGFKEDAKTAWERSLELSPDSEIANILLGLYYLDSSVHLPMNSPQSAELYKKAMTEYTQKAFKKNKDVPLTCLTFAGYFLGRKHLANAATLADKAVHYTDVNAIASDGWYIAARRAHIAGDHETANDYYKRSDDARGGIDRGYLPAKFGAAQLFVARNDFGEAKLRLEKMIQQSRNIEAMTLLGTIYAEEVFVNQYSNAKEDKSLEYKKAIGFLDSVRTAWKDAKRNLNPDASVLLNLARLYEIDAPEKSLQCLQQVEVIEMEELMAETTPPDDVEDEAAFKEKLRDHLPPQLLNNMGCFFYVAEKNDQAREHFQAGLNACINLEKKQEGTDTDALVTTISFNLARTYEASGMLNEAKVVYEGLLERHADYTDARTRLAYIALRQSPTDDGPRTMAKLYQEANTDLEVRALYGWYLGRVHNRKRNPNINEDPELRHYKHTLQHYEKHDRYALIGMGNLYLQSAREMRRESDSDKVMRSAMYSKAVEFFDKALQLDPKNAYAAQGIAIAMVEDKKDFKGALPIFMKVRDTLKDPNVYTNVGHIFAELRQYSKSLEHYEMALTKDRSHDAQILACLGRTWLAKARAEKSLTAYKNSLNYSQKALEVAPEQVHFQFNVAFVQIQLAQALYGMPEAQRSLAEVEDAAAGLEEAIESLEAIAQQPQPPYPKPLIEARANMARNTMRKQLERSIQSQKEYEEKNAEKMQAALEQRQAELKKQDDIRAAAMEAERERKRLVAEERQKISERDRELAEQRAEEEQIREAAEMTTDSETGEQVKRKRKPAKAKRKKKDGDDSDEGTGDERRTRRKERGSGADTDGEEKPKKKRRLAKKPKRENPKYKSSEIVVESDSDADDGAAEAAKAMDDETLDEDGVKDTSNMDVDSDEDDDDEDTAVAPVKRERAKRTTAIESDDDEDEDEEDAGVAVSPLPANGGDGGADTPMGEAPGGSDSE